MCKRDFEGLDKKVMAGNLARGSKSKTKQKMGQHYFSLWVLAILNSFSFICCVFFGVVCSFVLCFTSLVFGSIRW